ncbi:MAG TPA: epimerase [Chromatiaceae bacterium]|nr:MAG: SDR family oxidoreductase [Thiohalocapsa sp. PB-PSB1]HBG96145.1 epimerase [Chromatiaceae bacterium]HCS92183.1 epimerase [Chromatiaceae bacterium]
MQIALFGATGGTGLQVVEQALEAGHRIRALVRDPAKLPEREGLIVIQGDALDQDAVNRCVQGADAVICSLGSHGKAEPVEDLGTQCILRAMQAHGPRRLIAVTSMGVGDSIEQVAAVFRAIMKLTLRRVMEAKERQEQAIMASDLDWTIVRPGGLTNGPRTGNYQSGLDKSIKATRISRADVADFILKELAAGDYIRATPAVSLP